MKNIVIIFILPFFLFCKNENLKQNKFKESIITDLIKTINSSNPVSIILNNDIFLCEDAIIAIIESSKESKEQRDGLLEFIKARGGNSYGYMLETCPNPKEEHISKSVYFEFNFHASYPDRMQVLTRYRFHSKNFKLELYDILNNDYQEIKYDKFLLNQFIKDCKNEY